MNEKTRKLAEKFVFDNSNHFDPTPTQKLMVNILTEFGEFLEKEKDVPEKKDLKNRKIAFENISRIKDDLSYFQLIFNSAVKDKKIILDLYRIDSDISDNGLLEVICDTMISRIKNLKTTF